MTSVSATSATALQILQRSRTTPAPNELISAAKPPAKAAVAATATDKSSAVSSEAAPEDNDKRSVITAYGSFSGYGEAVAFVKNSTMSAYEKEQEIAGLDKMKAVHDWMESPEGKAIFETIDRYVASDEYKENQRYMKELTSSKEYLEAMAPLKAMDFKSYSESVVPADQGNSPDAEFESARLASVKASYDAMRAPETTDG